MKQPFTRDQRMTIIYGILCLVLLHRRASALAPGGDHERLSGGRRFGHLAGLPGRVRPALPSMPLSFGSFTSWKDNYW